MKKVIKTLEDKLNEGRQYRAVMEIRAIPVEFTDKKMVEGYATTFNQPYELYSDGNYTVNEQVDSRAFDQTDMTDVIMQYDHEGRVFARGSNGTLELSVDDYGLKITADLGGTEIGRQLYEEINGGYTTKMSFGFTVSDEERTETVDYDTGKVTVLRTITGIGKLYDVSAVSLPANNATEISARSYCDGVIAELTEEFRQHEEREQKKKYLNLLLQM